MAGAAQIHEEAVKQTSILLWVSHRRGKQLNERQFHTF